MGELIRLFKLDVFEMKTMKNEGFYKRLLKRWPDRIENVRKLESILSKICPEDGLKEGENNYVSRIMKHMVESG